MDRPFFSTPTTTTRDRRRRHAAGIVSLAAAIALVTVTLVSGQADAASRTRRLAGTFDAQPTSTPTCPAPTCSMLTFKGVIRGVLVSAATAVFPAEPPTNLIFEGTGALRTADGDLNVAATVVLNPDPASSGEATFMFKIVGGTGNLTGASGYIMAAGTAEVAGTTFSNVRYSGELVLP